jgi:FkbM family methyltransferase
MSAFRVNWLLTRIASPAFHRALRLQLKNPFTFCAATLLKIYPGVHDRPVELRLTDGKVIVARSFTTLFLFDEIFIEGVYEGTDTDAAVPTIVDIGANVGLFVIRAKQRWPEARIVAFEPDPENYAALEETIRRNRLAGVDAVKAAVTDETGSVMLFRHPRNSACHSTAKRHAGDAVSVPSVRIEDVLRDLPGGRCDLLKVDCEGGEEAIFRNLSPELAARIGTIVYEPEPGLYSPREMNDRLRSLGFRIIRERPCVVAAR